MELDRLTSIFGVIRPELTAYVQRLVVRPSLSEEIVQETFIHAYQAIDKAPESDEQLRAWLFRIATNLGIDELRRHGNWRETALLDLRQAAESNPEFVRQSMELAGTPETKAIAREHLAVCFSCTLRNLDERRAASLLLKEVHGFAIDEIAEWLSATPGQVKNWLQEARAAMDHRYAATCALIAKQGVCHQCVELDGFFHAGKGDPLQGSAKDIAARIDIVREQAAQPLGRWHQLMFGLLEDLR